MVSRRLPGVGQSGVNGLISDSGDPNDSTARPGPPGRMPPDVPGPASPPSGPAPGKKPPQIPQEGTETPGERPVAHPPPAPTQPTPLSATPGANVEQPPQLQPFQPMPSPGAGAILRSPAAAGAGVAPKNLFGAAGGLLGGGLGAAGGPNLAQSDPISSLIQALQQRNPTLGSF